MALKLFNTPSRAKEEFKPLRPPQVGLYSCGPTVYNFAHIGNLRSYVFVDLLKRALAYLGYQVTHGMNITDVGHLTGDRDFGEDKIEVTAKSQKRGPLEIAREYEKAFWDDADKLNVERPDKVIRATELIDKQIEIIKILIEREFAYQTDEAIYFDTSKLPNYGKENLLTGAREEVVTQTQKKNPRDFALWFFLSGKYKDHILRWESPWGPGFPGWHIECSAISREILGQPFDIHTGGVDHIFPHHANEMAQSEAAYGTPLANYWLHSEFLTIDGKRMGKSEGNLLTLSDIEKNNFDPLALRYFYLTAHYRSPINFTKEALAAAQNAYDRLLNIVTELKTKNEKRKTTAQNTKYEKEFENTISDDLNIPQALGVAWNMLKDNSLDNSVKLATILKFDNVFGLKLEASSQLLGAIPKEVAEIVQEREKLRRAGKWQESDDLRSRLSRLGFQIEDTDHGPKIRRM